MRDGTDYQTERNGAEKPDREGWRWGLILVTILVVGLALGMGGIYWLKSVQTNTTVEQPANTGN